MPNYKLQRQLKECKRMLLSRPMSQVETLKGPNVRLVRGDHETSKTELFTTCSRAETELFTTCSRAETQLSTTCSRAECRCTGAAVSGFV